MLKTHFSLTASPIDHNITALKPTQNLLKVNEKSQQRSLVQTAVIYSNIGIEMVP